jgi:glycosyltransferase involved in cell wall biosynthesis
LSKKKIIIITPSKFPGFAGDTANYTEIMNRLIDIGYEVILVCPRIEDRQGSTFEPNNLSIVRIPFSPPRLQSIGQNNRLRTYVGIFLFLITESFTVIKVVARCRDASIFMRHSILTIHLPILLKILNRRVVADGEFVSDSLANLIHPFWYKLVSRMEKKLINLYSAFKVSTQGQARGLEEQRLLLGKIIIIPVSIDTDKIPKHPVDMIPRNTFGYFGVLEDWQGVKILLSAFKLVTKAVPDALLYVIGDGSSKQYLEQFALNNGLSKNVHFVGSMSRERLWHEYFQKFRVAVIPRPKLNNSIDHILPIKLVEAMAAGKPVIAMNIDVMREIPNNAILLVQHPDPILLAEAMETLVNDESKLREYSTAAIYAARCYDIKENITKLTDVLSAK